MSIKLEASSIQTLMSTELNSLANGSAALGAEYDNATNLYIWGGFELNVTYGTNPTAGNTCDLYLIPAPDGTNYDDAVTGASGYAPPGSFLGSFALRAVTSAQKIPLGFGGPRILWLPPTKFKLFLINRAGVAMPASGSTVKGTLYRYQ